MAVLKGKPISPGIAIGKALLRKNASEEISLRRIENTEKEKERFHTAKDRAISQLEDIYEKMLRAKGHHEASIFLAHIQMLDDVEFITGVENAIEEHLCNAEWAVKMVRDGLMEIFQAMDDDYMRERAMDIKDISRRVQELLLGREGGAAAGLTEPVILLSEDLAPSDTAQMNPEFVLGIINETGGPTSHAAIIARTLGIPFVVFPGIMERVRDGELLAFDGENGVIELEADEAVLQEYRKKQEAAARKKQELEKLKGTKSITKDGHEILLAGNIGSPEDADMVVRQDGHSVGLFRTEFLYMNRTGAPDEEEQFQAYKAVAEKLQGGPVVIRTLDIGGDKEVDYLGIPKEENPFLGYRAIRLCLDRKPFWKTQLRALLRAGAFGNIHIMFPMIVSVEELRRAKEMVEEAKAELRAEGIDFNEKVPVGMMMETPAAALMADVFAREVDFFSIGTNDLIQYTMAVDRMNEKVAHLYSQYDPAVLRFIRKITESAHENGIWAGICGEAAADPLLLPVWVGLGLDELSMSPLSILFTRSGIQKLSKADCEKLTEEIFSLVTAKEVEEVLRSRRII